MIELVGQPAELTLTLQITSAATGEVRELKLIGHADPAALEALLKENENGSNPHDSSTQRCD